MPLDIAKLLIALLPRLRRYARVLARADDVADDLVQAACERALATARGPSDGAPFDAWMFRIVRNLWIDGGRRQQSEGVQLELDDPLAGDGVEGTVADTADLIDARRTLARVRGAIDTLPEDQRELLLLVCGEGMSYRDAAELLGVPIGTVMSRLSRGRARLAALAGLTDGADGIAGSAARPRDEARRPAAE
jgi:RNA polymerase sigma-70 factor (ECF subfamily)